MSQRIYENGEYLRNNPAWGAEDSPWKAQQVLKMIRRNALSPQSVCEVGCGAGEILNRLHEQMPDTVSFYGYEISPQAFEFCQRREKLRLSFRLRDILEEPDVFFDLLLAIDVIEHVEDCFGFLRELRGKARHKLFHIPLDISAQTVFRGRPLMTTRRLRGHIHLFTKDTALATLGDTGYEVLDWFYTPGSLQAPSRSARSRVLQWPRRMLYALNQDLAVRSLGGCSLMVLAT